MEQLQFKIPRKVKIGFFIEAATVVDQQPICSLYLRAAGSPIFPCVSPIHPCNQGYLPLKIYLAGQQGIQYPNIS